MNPSPISLISLFKKRKVKKEQRLPDLSELLVQASRFLLIASFLCPGEAMNPP